MKKLIPTLLLSLCTLAAIPASANQITIDFEHLPGADAVLGTADDTAMPNTFIQALRDQFSPIGLTFTQGTLFQSGFFDGNPANHYISSTNPIALLSTPVTGISIDSYSIWDAILTAYDVAGNAIGSERLVNPNAGSAFLRGSLSLTSTEDIYGFSILPDDPNHILNLDNLVLTAADPVSDVPEPSTLPLFALGLVLTGSLFRARSRGGRK